MHARSAHLGDDFPIMVLGEKKGDALRHHRPDIRRLQQFRFVGLHQLVEFAEVPRQIPGRRLADVANA